MTEQKKGLGRRQFLKVSGGAVIGAGVVAGGLVSGTQQAEAAPMPEKWDESYDVVVIGTGFSGTAAAIEAKIAGSSTVVLEKMPLSGGNSSINGGLITCAGSKLQEEKGVKDSPDLLLKDMLKAGLGLNNPELVRIIAQKSREVVDWSEDFLGVEYYPELFHLGGHSVPRTLKTKQGSGAAFVMPALKKLEELKVPVKNRVMVTKFVVDTDGRVKGVQVRDGYKFPDEESGAIKHIKAQKGVVVASGGFGNDLRFRQLEDPRLGPEVTTTNQPGATAECLIELLRIGATPIQLCWIQSGPWGHPDEKGTGPGAAFNLITFIQGLMVDPATGKRIVNELADRRIRAEAIFAAGHPCLTISDGDIAGHEGSYTAQIQKALEKGRVKKYDSLDEIAAAYNMPANDFKAQVNRYNEYVRNKEDLEFGKVFSADCRTVEKAPFYVGQAYPKIHHCMGGVQINKDAQVIDLDGEVIPGLYAAGEVTGGVHGACRLGSAAFLDCIVFGRVSGQNVAKETPWS